MKIQFFGASRQVTGSSYFLEAAGLGLLIDCGLYQERPLLARNWNPFPISPPEIDFILLTHAHLDHSGLLPKLVREGFSGKILATSASVDLVKIVLLDSARIQEEDAAFKKNRHQKEGRKGPYPEVPLYTIDQAERVFPRLEEVSYKEWIKLNKRLSLRFHDAGHILGSAMVEVLVAENKKPLRLIFSGDIGQWNKPLIKDPAVFSQADYIIMESTYGNRNHEDPKDVETLFCDIINETVKMGGNLVIPTFAVERAQELMFYLNGLVKRNRIPRLISFLDSPMAVEVTKVFENHPECLDEETLNLFRRGEHPFRFPGLNLTVTAEESKAINRIKGSCIIMAGSGMCTGGRIKHHLVHNISRPESTVLFVGYQARETLGRQILDGNPQVRIFGQYHPVKARIEQIHGFSGHADQKALLQWLSYFKSPPKVIFLTHGEEDVTKEFASLVNRSFGWTVTIPHHKEKYQLNHS